MPKRYGTPMPRQISPEAVNSATLAHLSFGAELFFWHLLAQVDDQGRLTGDFARLRHMCFGAREEVQVADIAAWLFELVRERLVLFYPGGDGPIVQVRSWQEFQSGQRWVYPSRWPGPDGWTDLPIKLPHGRTLNGAAPEPLQSGSGAAPPSGSGSGTDSDSGSGGDVPPELRSNDPYKLYRALTHKTPDRRHQKWMDDLTVQQGEGYEGRKAVADVMRQWPGTGDLLGWTKAKLRGGRQ